MISSLKFADHMASADGTTSVYKPCRPNEGGAYPPQTHKAGADPNNKAVVNSSFWLAENRQEEFWMADMFRLNSLADTTVLSVPRFNDFQWSI